MSININYGMTIMQSLKQLKATKLLSKRCVLKHTGWGLEYTAIAVYSKPAYLRSAAVAFSHKHSLPDVPSGLPKIRIKCAALFYSRHTRRPPRLLA